MRPVYTEMSGSPRFGVFLTHYVLRLIVQAMIDIVGIKGIVL